MAAGGERTGVMVVRMWIEGTEGSPSVRARLTETFDVVSAEKATHVAASVEQIVEIVRGWAQEFLDASGSTRTGP